MQYMMNGDYIVLAILSAGNRQFAMGINQNDGSFATWEAVGGEYTQAHSFPDRDMATEDLCSRTLEVLSMEKRQEKRKERGR